ncbi:MAG: hypothetical protein A4E67_02517 [Syntrophaceae bacterium PtaB.Bin038]|nr:MAG: hypothetical protein A4E67_02517 [Syntrophaceae bacterium PtaB.Bin038]
MKKSCTMASAFWGRAHVEKTVPLTGQRTARPPSSEVSFSKETTAIFLNTRGSPAVSAAVRTGALEAHPMRTGSTTQRTVRAATKDFEKGFTLPPPG